MTMSAKENRLGELPALPRRGSLREGDRHTARRQRPSIPRSACGTGDNEKCGGLTPRLDSERSRSSSDSPGGSSSIWSG